MPPPQRKWVIMSFRVKRLRPEATLPTKAYPSDAGYDLYASHNGMICGHCVGSIHTAIAVEIPPGYAMIIKGRSSLAFGGLTPFGGVIDSGYRGEVKVLLYNTFDSPFTYAKGDRIAQALIVPVADWAVEEVKELSASPRGGNGFGSSGV